MSSITPQISKIPSNGDPKNFNILQFSGIDLAESPFSTSAGSASDMLNLYVNAEGVLATRPRLEWCGEGVANDYIVEDAIKWQESMWILIGKKLDSNGSVIGWYMSRAAEEGGMAEADWEEVSVAGTSERVKIFLNDEKVPMLLCSNGYFYYEEGEWKNVINSEKAYVPTIKTGAYLDDPDSGKDLEHRNLLTNKYKKTYFFDVDTPSTAMKSDVSYSLNVDAINTEEISGAPIPTTVLARNKNGDILYVSTNEWQTALDTTPITLHLLSDNKHYTYPDKITASTIRNILRYEGNMLPLYDVKLLEGGKFLISSIAGLFDDTIFYSLSVTEHDFSTGLENEILRYNNILQSEFYDNDADVLVGISIFQKTSTEYILYTVSSDEAYRFENLDAGLVRLQERLFTIQIKGDVTLNKLKEGTTTMTAPILEVSDFVDFFVFGDIDNDQTLVFCSTFKYSNVNALLRKIIYTSSEDVEWENIVLRCDVRPKHVVIYDDIIALTNERSTWTFNKQNLKKQEELLFSGGILLSEKWLWSIDGPWSSTLVSIEQDQNRKTISSETALNIITNGQYSTKKYIYLIEDNGTIAAIKIKDINEPVINAVETFMDNPLKFSYDAMTRFDNKLWFYHGSSTDNSLKNTIIWTYDYSGYYIEDGAIQTIGDDKPVTAMMQVSNEYAAVFKEDATYLVASGGELDEFTKIYLFEKMKTDMGHVPIAQAIVASYSSQPIVINNYGFFALGQNKNVTNADEIFYSITDKIHSKIVHLKNKKNLKTHNHGFLTYFYLAREDDTIIWVLDNRTGEWFYWELPVCVEHMVDTYLPSRELGTVVTHLWTSGDCYYLTDLAVKTESKDSNDGDSCYLIYEDHLSVEKSENLLNNYKKIPWRWRSQALSLNIINYLKKLSELGLLFADRDRELTMSKDPGSGKWLVDDSYDGMDNNLKLFYTLKTYRKKTRMLDGSYSGQLDYVGNKRLKIRAQKFDYAILELSNRFDEETYTKTTIDKLNLTGITFKFTLSSGA